MDVDLKDIERAGYNAAKNGHSRMPAHSFAVQEALEGLKPGEGAEEILKAWLNGYQRRCDHEAYKIINS